MTGLTVKEEEGTYTYRLDGASSYLPPLLSFLYILWILFALHSRRSVIGFAHNIVEASLKNITHAVECFKAWCPAVSVLYDITRVDTFEGYKEDITLYCKRRARQECGGIRVFSCGDDQGNAGRPGKQPTL